MAFLKERRTMGMKIEGTPYTAETLTQSDYNMRVENIEYDTDLQITARKLARGDASVDTAIIGKRSINIKFRFELYPQVNAASAIPAFITPFQASGWSVTHSGGVVTLNPSSKCTNVPATINVQEIGDGVDAGHVDNNGILVKASGCMGVIQIKSGKVGEPVYIECDFKGAFNGFEQLDIPVVSFDCLATIGSDIAGISIHASAVQDTITFDSIVVAHGNGTSHLLLSNGTLDIYQNNGDNVQDVIDMADSSVSMVTFTDMGDRFDLGDLEQTVITSMDNYRVSQTRMYPYITDTNMPEPMLSSLVTLGTIQQVCDKVSINPGAKVELYSSPAPDSGFIGAHVSGEREASIELDPDIKSLADEDWWGRFTDGDPLAFSMAIGSHIRITAPAAQIVQTGKPGDREGHLTNSLKLRACRGNAGDDELSIEITDKA